MSMLLAMAAASAVASGTSFDCEVVTRKFSVFAPNAETTAKFSGNVLTLYKFDAQAGAFGEAGVKVAQVFDGLPDNLYLQLDDGSNSPIDVTIFEIDPNAGTARASIMEDLTPEAAQRTMIGLEGSCMVMPGDGKEGA